MFFISKSNGQAQVSCALCSALCYLCIGLVRSWASTSVPSLNGNVNGTGVSYPVAGAPLDAETVSWIVSLPPLLAILGSVSSSVFLNFLGRRNSIILSGFILTASFAMIYLADFMGTPQVLLLAGRAICGFGVGLGMPATAIYVAEVSSPQMRGKLSSLPALLLALGVLLGYVLGLVLAWHHLALVSAAPGLVLVATMLFMPESPPHLATRRRLEAGARALARLRGISREEASKEMKEMSARAPSSRSSGGVLAQLSECLQGSTLRPLALSLMLHFVQSWCGFNVMIFKTVEVFRMLRSSIDPFHCTFIVGIVQLAATGMSLLVVDRAGRRVLLMISGSVMAVCMAGLATYLTLGDAVPDSLRWLPLVLVIGVFVGYSVGFATIPFCIMGELLPLSTRNITGAISSAFNLATLFSLLKFYTSLGMVIGYSGVYWLFSGVSLLGVLLVFFLLPETKGKSLSEIEEIFR